MLTTLYPLLSFILYFITLCGIGFHFYRKKSSAAEYMVGSRSVNYWVTAIATQASDMGSWLFMGLPAVIYMRGLFEYWSAIGLIIGMFLCWQYIAPRLRSMTEQYNSLTLFSFLSARVQDDSGLVRLVSVIPSLLFFTFYIASGLVGLSLLFTSAFGISYHLGMIISLCTVTLYTLVGGFVAVAWCDFFQGIFLMSVIVLIPLVAFFKLGSLEPIITVSQAHNISLSLWSTPLHMLYALSLALGWGLGYFGQPHILTNFMGIDDVKSIRYAKYIGISWQIIVLTASAAVGIIGIGYFQYSLTNPQLVFITMTQSLFHPFVAGIMLCAIVAATLSTVDTLILISGSMLAEDMYKRFFNPTISSNHLVWASRSFSLIICFITLCIAWNTKQSIYDLVNYAWSGLGSTFGPAVIMSLYSKHLNRNGMIAGMITGCFFSAIWPLFQTPVLPLVPGFFSGLLVMYLVSRWNIKKAHI